MVDRVDAMGNNDGPKKNKPVDPQKKKAQEKTRTNKELQNGLNGKTAKSQPRPQSQSTTRISPEAQAANAAFRKSNPEAAKAIDAAKKRPQAQLKATTKKTPMQRAKAKLLGFLRQPIAMLNEWGKDNHVASRLGSGIVETAWAPVVAPVVVASTLTSCQKNDDAEVRYDLTPEKLKAQTLKALHMPKYIPDGGWKTSGGVSFEFFENDKSVTFDNGLIYNLDDDVTVMPNAPMGKLNAMLNVAGLRDANTPNSSISMDITALQGSYGNNAPGFSMQIVTPQNLKSVANGNPKMQMSICGQDFTGTLSKTSEGNLVLKTQDNKQIIIRQGTYNDDGYQLNGMYINLPDGNEYFMTKHPADVAGQQDGTDIIRVSDGFMQYYSHNNTQFNSNISGRVKSIYGQMENFVRSHIVAIANAEVNINGRSSGESNTAAAPTEAEIQNLKDTFKSLLNIE